MNRPVAIDAVQPPVGVVMSSVGSKVIFTVDAHDPEGDAITYAWLVNGKLADWTGNTPTLDLEVTGTDLVNVGLTVTGTDGTELSKSWSVITGLVGDFDRDNAVGFADFLLFVGAFGRNSASPSWDSTFDLNGDDSVGFNDFLIFVQYFGISL